MSPEERRLAAAECHLLVQEIRALERRATQLISDLEGSPARLAFPAGPAAGGPGEGPPARRGAAP